MKVCWISFNPCVSANRGYDVDDGDCCDDEDEDEDEDEDDEEEEEAEDDEDKPNGDEDKGLKSTGAEESYRQQVMDLIEVEGEETLFPPLDGTAFYLLTCKINHSCDPNVRVTYINDQSQGLLLRMVAIKDIQPEEELVQSYIDQNLSKKERQKALVDYGFKCGCTKCTTEK